MPKLYALCVVEQWTHHEDRVLSFVLCDLCVSFAIFALRLWCRPKALTNDDRTSILPMAVQPSASPLAVSDRPWARDLAVLVAGIGLGLAMGLRRAAPLEAPSPPGHPVDGASIAVTSSGDDDDRRGVTAPRVPTTPIAPSPPLQRAARGELAAAIEVNEGELRTLARALSDPTTYRHVRAVLGDLESFEAALRRRLELFREHGAEPPPPPQLPPGLRERAHELATSRAAALVLEVVEVPDHVEVLAPAPASSVDPRRPGVVLANDGPVRTVTFRTRAGAHVRAVEVREDPQAGCDRLRVTYTPVGPGAGTPTFARTARLVGPPGKVWQDLIAHLWERGAAPFHALEALVDGGAPALPSRRGGWIDWVRLHVGLPPNPELNEPVGPPPPLPADNPLLLVDGALAAQPILLERPDLELDPEREAPPLLSPARGPLVFLARNALGVFDGGWRWLVFDPARARAVEHLPGEGPGGGHLRWELFPDADRPRLGRGPELSQALARLAQERTRQALALLLRRREVAALEREQEARVGGMYSADGLAVVRLDQELAERHKKLQALSHLLLDADAAARSDRALEEARRRSVARLTRLIEAMIDADRRGPAEYLLRDERVKTILFEAPQAYRLRLAQVFRARYGAWHGGLLTAFGGEPPHWYEVH